MTPGFSLFTFTGVHWFWNTLEILMHMLPRDHCVRNLQLSVKVYIVMSLRNEIMHIHITVSVEQIVSSKQTLKKTICPWNIPCINKLWRGYSYTEKLYCLYQLHVYNVNICYKFLLLQAQLQVIIATINYKFIVFISIYIKFRFILFTISLYLQESVAVLFGYDPTWSY